MLVTKKTFKSMDLATGFMEGVRYANDSAVEVEGPTLNVHTLESEVLVYDEDASLKGEVVGGDWWTDTPNRLLSEKEVTQIRKDIGEKVTSAIQQGIATSSFHYEIDDKKFWGGYSIC